MSISVGVVRPATEQDFAHFRQLCDDDSSWKVAHKVSGVEVFTKTTSDSKIKMLKVRCKFDDLKPDVIYDTLQDVEYRTVWDRFKRDGYPFATVDRNNDLSYYWMKSIKPLADRDFVTQRSWLARDNEYIVFNHSVYHKNYPPKSGVVRGTSYITGYMMSPHKSGSKFTYVTQSDPRGKIPTFVVNQCCVILVPNVVRSLRKAAKGYSEWKAAQQNPNYKPWLHPEQSKVPPINWDEILTPGEGEKLLGGSSIDNDVDSDDGNEEFEDASDETSKKANGVDDADDFEDAKD